MGNVCGGSKLQVHIQESFTYETILDRYIDAHLQELIANAMHLTERCSTQPTIDTSTWADPSSLQVTDRLERRLSMRQEQRQSQEQDQTLFKVPQSDAEHRGSDKHLPDAAQERRGSQSDPVQERSGTTALPAKPSGSAAAQRPSGGPELGSGARGRGARQEDALAAAGVGPRIRGLPPDHTSHQRSAAIWCPNRSPAD
ncbi:uncharacterized protein LOC119111167 [Pollicipes pollicipes]|uniref:uncharacterized protein LOC119111167 n=1 Tax=Pollicipes pollicipes TaxID=41117 RepID=UPI00188510F3|nr:uncharacterized protein LOC119111167 [Pollicipes pollicipes]